MGHTKHSSQIIDSFLWVDVPFDNMFVFLSSSFQIPAKVQSQLQFLRFQEIT